jgi:hypothetical protein
VDTSIERKETMKKSAVLIFMLTAVVAMGAAAEHPETFDQAKILSAQQGKPLLIDFFVVW